MAIFTNLIFYSLGLVRVVFPWSILALVGLFYGERFLRRDIEQFHFEYKLLACLIFPTLLFFIFIIREQTRLRYLLPIAPAVCIVSARYFVLLGGEKGRSLLRPAAFLSLGLLLAMNLIFNLAIPSLFPRAQELALNKVKAAAVSLPASTDYEIAFIADSGERKNENWQTFMSAISGKAVKRFETFEQLPTLTRPRFIIASLADYQALPDQERYELLDTIRTMKQWSKSRHFKAALRGEAEMIELVVLRQQP